MDMLTNGLLFAGRGLSWEDFVIMENGRLYGANGLGEFISKVGEMNVTPARQIELGLTVTNF